MSYLVHNLLVKQAMTCRQCTTGTPVLVRRYYPLLPAMSRNLGTQGFLPTRLGAGAGIGYE
ncbi:hypothetical protein PCANC_25848 [Puccinia coronata f. sp. avenae]|uniref:Uncharacterized protein n=1 Tax=Puccinia coronata f. sp. avenae TaxID=200324 RepID=A0A2N5TPI2_9BASI|nr:hypothetical protein PCANC_25848 [Puccinia coronata f. sp. avenae]